MKQIILTCVLLGLYCGCVKSNSEEQEQTAVIRLNNAFDGIVLVMMDNSNRVANAGFTKIIEESSDRDPLIKELLTKRTGGYSSSLLLNTNADFWLNPDSHGQEIAIVLPDRIKRNEQWIGIAIRFDRKIVCYICLK